MNTVAATTRHSGGRPLGLTRDDIDDVWYRLEGIPGRDRRWAVPDVLRVARSMADSFEFDGAIVPWGRNAAEYEAFFALGDVPPSTRVLDCGSGPASFCAEWSGRGRFVVAMDPVYARSADEIGEGFEQTAVSMLAGMRSAQDRFHWAEHGSPEAVVERRRSALNTFLDHLGDAGAERRYIASALPELPFAPDAFDLVLCSHMLFLYSEELSLSAHIACLREMLRVGREVRVFPLHDMNGQRSAHLDGCVRELSRVAHVEVTDVPYEFRVDDTSMLRLTRLQ